MFNSKIEQGLKNKIKNLDLEQLKQSISKRNFKHPLVNKTQLYSSLGSSFIGLRQENKFNSFYNIIRLLEHSGYLTLLSDDKDMPDQDRFAWLTVLPHISKNSIDINSFKIEGVNINSLNDGVFYLDFDSETAIDNFTSQLDVAITDWHLTFVDEVIDQITDHIVGQSRVVLYQAVLNQLYLDQAYIDYYGGGIVAKITFTNEDYPLVNIWFHDKDIDPNIPAPCVKYYPLGLMWIELHKSKEYYVPYLDLLRNEYPINARFDTRRDSIVDICALFKKVGWGHHSRYE